MYSKRYTSKLRYTIVSYETYNGFESVCCEEVVKTLVQFPAYTPILLSQRKVIRAVMVELYAGYPWCYNTSHLSELGIGASMALPIEEADAPSGIRTRSPRDEYDI